MICCDLHVAVRLTGQVGFVHIEKINLDSQTHTDCLQTGTHRWAHINLRYERIPCWNSTKPRLMFWETSLFSPVLSSSAPLRVLISEFHPGLAGVSLNILRLLEIHLATWKQPLEEISQHDSFYSGSCTSGHAQRHARSIHSRWGVEAWHKPHICSRPLTGRVLLTICHLKQNLLFCHFPSFSKRTYLSLII